MKTKLFMIHYLLFLMLCAVGLGTDLYVNSDSGTDDTYANGYGRPTGTENGPFASLDYAYNQAATDDVIHIEDITNQAETTQIDFDLDAINNIKVIGDSTDGRQLVMVTGVATWNFYATEDGTVTLENLKIVSGDTAIGNMRYDGPAGTVAFNLINCEITGDNLQQYTCQLEDVDTITITGSTIEPPPDGVAGGVFNYGLSIFGTSDTVIVNNSNIVEAVSIDTSTKAVAFVVGRDDVDVAVVQNLILKDSTFQHSRAAALMRGYVSSTGARSSIENIHVENCTFATNIAAGLSTVSMGLEYDEVTPWDDLTGTHDGGDASADLTDDDQSWEEDSLIGCTVTNTTNSETATITDNTDDDATGTLSGGESWDDGDGYKFTVDIGTVVQNEGNIFECIVAHDVTTANSEPSSGSLSDVYWKLYQFGHVDMINSTFDTVDASTAHNLFVGFGCGGGYYRGLTFTGGTGNGAYQIVCKGENNVFENCYITGCKPVFFAANGGNRLVNSYIYSTDDQGIIIGPQGTTYSTNNAITKCIFRRADNTDMFIYENSSGTDLKTYMDFNVYDNSAADITTLNATDYTLAELQAAGGWATYASSYIYNDQNSTTRSVTDTQGYYIDIDSDGTKEWIGIPQTGDSGSSGGIFNQQGYLK